MCRPGRVGLTGVPPTDMPPRFMIGEVREKQWSNKRDYVGEVSDLPLVFYLLCESVDVHHHWSHIFIPLT